MEDRLAMLLPVGSRNERLKVVDRFRRVVDLDRYLEERTGWTYRAHLHWKANRAG